MPEFLLTVFFLLILFHYLIFLVTVFSGLKKLKLAQSTNDNNNFLSIIVPFRNEEKNILDNLKSLEAQKYPKDNFEIIYVNDFSEDNSENILKQNITKNNITVISVPNHYSKNAHKKRAVRFGIENSKGELLFTSDADCTYNNNWLQSILNYFDEETAFVSGPVEFYDRAGLFNKSQKLEFAGLVLTGAGLIGAGKPTICNAANIAYRRNVFDEVNGFSDNLNLSSGDDELLMQKIAKDTDYKVKFSIDPDSIVKTASSKSISEFYHQRKRWASKGLFYSDKSLILKLVLIYMFYISLVVQLLLALYLSPVFWITYTISTLTKFIIEYLIIKKGRQIVFPSLSLKPFLVTEILQIPYIIIAGLLGAFGNYKWKNRKVAR